MDLSILQQTELSLDVSFQQQPVHIVLEIVRPAAACASHGRIFLTAAASAASGRVCLQELYRCYTCMCMCFCVTPGILDVPVEKSPVLLLNVPIYKSFVLQLEVPVYSTRCT